jgi:hypothetical protein
MEKGARDSHEFVSGQIRHIDTEVFKICLISYPRPGYARGLTITEIGIHL